MVFHAYCFCGTKTHNDTAFSKATLYHSKVIMQLPVKKEIFEVNQWKALRNRRLFLIKLIEKRDNLETKCNQLQISVVADKFESFIENKSPMDRYRLPFPIKFFLYYFR